MLELSRVHFFTTWELRVAKNEKWVFLRFLIFALFVFLVFDLLGFACFNGRTLSSSLFQNLELQVTKDGKLCFIFFLFFALFFFFFNVLFIFLLFFAQLCTGGVRYEGCVSSHQADGASIGE